MTSEQRKAARETSEQYGSRPTRRVLLTRLTRLETALREIMKEQGKCLGNPWCAQTTCAWCLARLALEEV